MKPISICLLVIAALAATIQSESQEASPESKVVIHAIPSQVAVTGAIPIPISEVLKDAMKQNLMEELEETGLADDREDIVGDEKKLTKRWWHKEEETPPAPTGWGLPTPHMAPSYATQEAPSPSLVGPFAFQLGAYYNPLIPAPVESPPAYPRYPSAPRPAYNAPSTYSPSPSYAPASSSYSPPASLSYSPPAASSYSPPAASSYSPPASSSYSPPASSSYSPPASYSSSSYTPPASSYSPPASSYSPASYSSSSYTPPASSYSPPSSYSAPSSYTPPSSSYSPPASYSAPSSYSPSSSYSSPY